MTESPDDVGTIEGILAVMGIFLFVLSAVVFVGNVAYWIATNLGPLQLSVVGMSVGAVLVAVALLIGT